MPTTVSGNIRALGTGTATGTVRFWLRGTGGNQPRVNGTAIVAPSQGGTFFWDIVSTANGTLSGTLYSTRDAAGTGNGDIEVGGSLTAVWYGMAVMVNGKLGPEVPVHAKSGATLDPSNVTPITTDPVVAAPTGDSTYARIDGGNTPFTGLAQFSAGALTNKLNNVRFADQFAGADLGAKINAADADLGVTSGEIWLIGGGTISTAVSISASHTVRIFPGAYSQSAAITLAANTAIVAENPRSAVLTMTAANTHQLSIAGSNVVVRGLELVQTGSGTGDNINANGSYSQLRISDNELASGYHAFSYTLGATAANSIWFTNNLVNSCGRTGSAVGIFNLNGVVSTPILLGVHVEGNIFSGSGAAAGVSAAQIFCSNSSLGIRDAVYANNTVFNSSGGGLWGAGVDGFTFTGNHIYATANEGIDAELSQNVSMSGNVIKGAGGTAVTILGLVGGAVSTTSTTTVSAGTVATVTPAAMTNIVPLGQLYVDSAGTPETVQVLSVTATTFTAYFASAHGPGSWNIVGAGTGSNTVSISRDIAISGNSIESSGSAFAGAIHVDNGTFVTISGNQIHNPAYHGIQAGVSGGAGSKLYVNNISVTGNSISSDTLNASTVGIRIHNGGIAGQMEGYIVSGNAVNRFPTGIALIGSSAEQSVVGLNNIRNCTADYATDSSSLPSTSILSPLVGTNINGLIFGGAKDTNLYRSAAGVLSTSYTNGEVWSRGSISELITLNTGGLTTDSSANLLPSNSIIEAVVARVTTTITTTTSWALGDAAQAARFASANTNLTAGSAAIGLNHADPTVASSNLGPVQGSAAKLRITCAGANPGAGAIRVTVFFRQFGAPTS